MGTATLWRLALRAAILPKDKNRNTMKKSTIITIIIAAVSVMAQSCNFTESLKVRVYVKRYVKTSEGGHLKSFKYTPEDTVYTYKAAMEILDKSLDEANEAHRLMKKAETCKMVYDITGSVRQLQTSLVYIEMAQAHIEQSRKYQEEADATPPEVNIVKTASVTYIDDDGETCEERYVIDGKTLTVKCPASEYGSSDDEGLDADDLHLIANMYRNR